MIFAAGPGVSAAAIKAVTDPVTEAFGPNAVHHHFAGGVYAKETRIPAGHFVVSHKHPYDHLSILASGLVSLTVDGVKTYLRGPAAAVIRKEVEHRIFAVDDSVWYCIHATAETDPEKVDGVILGREKA